MELNSAQIFNVKIFQLTTTSHLQAQAAHLKKATLEGILFYCPKFLKVTQNISMSLKHRLSRVNPQAILASPFLSLCLSKNPKSKSFGRRHYTFGRNSWGDVL